MKRHIRFWVALSALALAGLTACGSTTTPAASTTAPTSSAAGSSTLHTASTSLGTIVVNGAEMTVYFFTADKAGESASACTGPCASLWPAVSTSSATPSVTGVTGTIGTITGVDGSQQVTLNGLPLYTYAADKKPGDTSGQGFSGKWWVVSASGDAITSAPATSPMVTTTPSQGGSGY